MKQTPSSAESGITAFMLLLVLMCGWSLPATAYETAKLVVFGELGTGAFASSAPLPVCLAQGGVVFESNAGYFSPTCTNDSVGRCRDENGNVTGGVARSCKCGSGSASSGGGAHLTLA